MSRQGPARPRWRRAPLAGTAFLLLLPLLLLLPSPAAAAADTAPPYVSETSVPVGGELLVGGPEASVGVFVCDNDSAIPSASAEAVDPSGTSVAHTDYVLAPVVDSHCRDILFILFETAVGRTIYSITVEDAAHNPVTVGPFFIVRQEPTINFSAFNASGPFPVLNLNVTLLAEAGAGQLINLSSVEWTVVDTFGETPEWHDAGLSGTASNATLVAPLALPHSETYYAQWSAKLAGGDTRFFSRLYPVTADVDPPAVTQFDCGPTHPAGDTVPLTVGVMDEMTGPNLNETRILVTDANGQSTNTTPDASQVLSERRGTVEFTVHLFPGTNQLELFAFDHVGNRNAVTTCALERPDPSAEPPSVTAPADGDPLPLLLVGTAAVGGVLVYAVLRAGREQR